MLRDGKGTPDAIIIATGSEIGLAMAAADALKGKNIRVVSMPSVEVFNAQDDAYRNSVLPPAVKARVAIKTNITSGWYKYVSLDGKVIGIDRFGESAPAPQLFEYFGFTTENVVKAVEDIL